MYTLFRGGYNAKHSKSFILSRPQGVEHYVMLHVKTPTHFWFADNTFDILSNSIIIIRPNTPYQYSAINTEYKNDWMHFSCDFELFESICGSIINRPVRIQNPLQFTQYFQHIIWEYHYSCDEFKEQNIAMLFQVLLNKLLQEANASVGSDNYNPYASKLQELRLTMQSQPNKNFTPEELAEKLNVSPSYFQHLYKEFFDIPFKKDLIEMRLNYARDLILNTTLTFEQVAYMSGYTNEIHFYRQFKAKIGMTPKEYQQAMKPHSVL